jgi:hypothetical protein
MSKMNKDIHDELKEIAPSLASIQIKPPNPKIPDGYFEALEKQLLSQAKIASMSQNFDNDLPNSYFENLEANVMSQLGQKETKVIRLPRYVQYRWAVAACSVLIVCAALFTFMKSERPVNDNSIAINITSDEAIEYMETQSEDIQIDELIEAGVIDSTMVEELSFYESIPSDGDELIFESELDF